MLGEALVARLTQGRLSRRGSSYDCSAGDASIRLEVKSSSLLHVRGKEVKRWLWSKLLGQRGIKEYDRVILVGEADSRFSQHYADFTAPFVLFDLSYLDVLELTEEFRPSRFLNIQLTTNPSTVRSLVARRMYEEFHVSAAEVERRYGRAKPIRSRIPGERSNRALLTDWWDLDADRL